MNPLEILALLSGGLNATGSVIGTPNQMIGDPSSVTNLNAEQTQQALELLNQQIQQYQTQLAGSDQALSGLIGGLGDLSTQQLAQGQAQLGTGIGTTGTALDALGRAMQGLQTQQAFDPTAGIQQFQAEVPIYQDLAQQARTQALADFDIPAAQLASLQADANIGAAANQFANLGASTSGAAAAAAAQGAAQPLANLQLQRGQLGNQAYQNTLNPLLQQGLGQAQQAQQFGYQADTQNLMNQLAGAGQQAGIGAQQAAIGQQDIANALSLLGQQVAAQQGQSALYAGLQGQGLQGLLGLSAPNYWEPTYAMGSGILGMTTGF